MSESTETAGSSLLRMQDFDIKKLPRTEELGLGLNFQAVVPHAERLIGLYKCLSAKSGSRPTRSLGESNQIPGRRRL